MVDRPVPRRLAPRTPTADGAADGGDAAPLTVESTDDACDVSAAEAPSGTLTFDVTNTGSQVTEFYLLGEDGLRIVGEVENIGPSLTASSTVNAPAGNYVTACKPGMKGDGIRADFTVTESDEDAEVSADDQELVDQALTNYAAYVAGPVRPAASRRPRSSSTSTRPATTTRPARSTRWPAPTGSGSRPWPSRSATSTRRWTPARPTSSPARSGPAGTAIEKDLWPARAETTRRSRPRSARVYADDLLANTDDPRRSGCRRSTYTVDQIANGSSGLLDEVATGKVTGEEEIWSHTDLWDFQANVDGARVGLRGRAGRSSRRRTPSSPTSSTTRFAELQTLLDAQRVGDGFMFYDELTPGARSRRSSDAVNALSEPLSKLTAAVLS